MENSLDRNVIEAFQSKRVSNYTKEELAEFVVACLNEANKRVSKRACEETLDQATNDLLFELRSGFRGFGIREIRLAIYRGSTGAYGEVYGVNSKQVMDWIRKYKSIEREPAMKERKRIIDKMKEDEQARIDEKKRKEFHNLVVDMYDHYCETGQSMKGLKCKPWNAYRHLAITLGYDIIPVSEKNKIYEKAEKEFVFRYKDEKEKAKAGGDRAQFEKIVERIKSKPKDLVKRIAMNNSLEYLMDLMKEQKIKIDKYD